MFFNWRENIIKVSVIYFFLLTGYKFFSLYYPLFLSWKGISLFGVGLNYFFLYFSLGIFAFLFSFFRVSKPKLMIILSICGYALYSLSMLFISSLLHFLLLQLLLGFFAGMFYVFARVTILEKTKARAGEYGYFYIAPIASSFLAPLIGGLLIYFIGFFAAFVASIVMYGIAIIFTLTKMKSFTILEKKRKFKIKEKLPLLFFLLVSVVVGLYRAFFVLFLKDIGLTRNDIVLFLLTANIIVFLPLLLARRRFDIYSTRKSITIAAMIYGLITAIITLVKILPILFVLFILQFFLFIFLSSQKSGWLARLSIYKKEIAILDTCIESFGVGTGALLAGILLEQFSFELVFILFSFLLLTVTSIFYVRR